MLPAAILRQLRLDHWASSCAPQLLAASRPQHAIQADAAVQADATVHAGAAGDITDATDDVTMRLTQQKEQQQHQRDSIEGLPSAATSALVSAGLEAEHSDWAVQNVALLSAPHARPGARCVLCRQSLWQPTLSTYVSSFLALNSSFVLLQGERVITALRS